MWVVCNCVYVTIVPKTPSMHTKEANDETSIQTACTHIPIGALINLAWYIHSCAGISEQITKLRLMDRIKKTADSIYQIKRRRYRGFLKNGSLITNEGKKAIGVITAIRRSRGSFHNFTMTVSATLIAVKFDYEASLLLRKHA